MSSEDIHRVLEEVLFLMEGIPVELEAIPEEKRVGKLPEVDQIRQAVLYQLKRLIDG